MWNRPSSFIYFDIFGIVFRFICSVSNSFYFIYTFASIDWIMDWPDHISTFCKRNTTLRAKITGHSLVLLRFELEMNFDMSNFISVFYFVNKSLHKVPWFNQENVFVLSSNISLDSIYILFQYSFTVTFDRYVDLGFKNVKIVDFNL